MLPYINEGILKFYHHIEANTRTYSLKNAVLAQPLLHKFIHDATLCCKHIIHIKFGTHLCTIPTLVYDMRLF